MLPDAYAQQQALDATAVAAGLRLADPATVLANLPNVGLRATDIWEGSATLNGRPVYFITAVPGPTRRALLERETRAGGARLTPAAPQA